jgi:acyl carrier protein phosphodiesterase
VDIFFDHFLANDPRYFTDRSLLIFTRQIYDTLQQSSYLFDEKMSMFFSYMAQHNWLYHYSEKEGIEKSVRGICKRYPRLGDAEKAIHIFENNFDKLNGLYAAFFPELRDMSQQKMIELNRDQRAS